MTAGVRARSGVGMKDTALSRRVMLASAAATGALAVFPARAQTSRASALYARATVIDSLGAPGGYDPAAPDAEGLTPRLLDDVRASGLTACNVTVSQVGNVADAFETTVTNISQWDEAIASHPDLLMCVRSAADLRAAKSSGKVGLIYGFQDTTPLGPDLARLETFANFGVRIVQPTYNRRNLMGDGCLEPGNAGLSKLGYALVGELNKRRIVVDMSHAGVRTQTEAIAASTRPPVITHTGCRALNDHPRNTHDAVMRAVADKGGTVGIYFMPFLRNAGQPHAADLIAHIEHAWGVAGEDHVGLGTDGSITGLTLDARFRKDFAATNAARHKGGIAAPGEQDDVFLYVPEYNTPRRFETLAGDLLARGHGEAKVQKLLGANFARVLAEVWG